MGTKTSRNAKHGGVIAWEPPAPPPVPEVIELYGDEADRQWAAACLNQYLDPHERAFAPTAASPLL
jgi:hypothetical protein